MKKVMVTLISLATLGLGIIVPLQANAQQPINQGTGVSSQSQFRRHQSYRVQYRRHRQKNWMNAGTYQDRTMAQRYAQRLQRQGYETRIVTF